MAALLILPIREVKFLAIVDVKFLRVDSPANPRGQCEQRRWRQSHRPPPPGQRLRTRPEVRPRQRQVAGASVGQLGSDPVAKRSQHDDLSTAPGMDTQGDPKGLVRLAPRPLRSVIASSAGRAAAPRSRAARCRRHRGNHRRTSALPLKFGTSTKAPKAHAQSHRPRRVLANFGSGRSASACRG